jgi:hypothetical protein
MKRDADSIQETCRRALTWAKDRNYTGYNKHDGLNSPLLRTLSCNNKWLRILFIQGVMRSPVNVRPLLLVRKARNPKGLALFARAHLNLYRVTGDEEHRKEAERLLTWLLDNPSQGFAGKSWGYGYPWQDMGFFAPAGFPNRIVTYFVGRALIHAHEELGDPRYLEAAGKAVEFILKAPKVLHEDEMTKCVSYVPVEAMTMAVMDVSALCGALVAMVGKHTGRSDLLDEAKRLLSWVVDKQTDYGAWYYTFTAGDSHITHDNYHTGEIVDSLLEYRFYSGDESFSEAYRTGLDYYRENLFTAEGRPKWMHDCDYPHDIHGYSQGIITFSLAGELDLAHRIARGAIEDMCAAAEGRFYHQRRRLYTKRFTLMRWCQGWMTYALSTLLVASDRREEALPWCTDHPTGRRRMSRISGTATSARPTFPRPSGGRGSSSMRWRRSGTSTTITFLPSSRE